MFSQITVVGLGLIGGSLCRAIKHVYPKTQITGIDKGEVIDRARKAKLVDRAEPAEHLPQSCQNAELVIVATPIRPARELLPIIAQNTGSDAIVTDVCSLKSELVALAQTLFTGKNGWFIGGHPMAGSQLSGFEHADPFLFQNAIYVLCPVAKTPAVKLSALAALVYGIGAHGVVMAPEVHDRIAAAVSHLPQLLAVALMQFIAGKSEHNPLYLKMAAGGFRDMTRIASSPFTIWRDICEGNRQKISDEIDGFVEKLRELQSSLQAGALQPEFESAARGRLSIPQDTRGFLKAHFDLTVVVEDKPGVIAQIAGPLAKNGINIKDIQVLKVRENEGGTIRLAFESQKARKQARTVLTSLGFRCQMN